MTAQYLLVQSPLPPSLPIFALTQLQLGLGGAQKGQISEADSVTGARVVAKLGPESE
jgi:hypothetical protein